MTAAVPVALTRFGGGVAFMWLASGLLGAKLLLVPVRHWRDHALACGLASIVVTGLFGLGWQAAPALAAINVAEAVFAAAMLASLRNAFDLGNPMAIARSIAVCGLLAPLPGTLEAAYVAQLVTGTPYAVNALHWAVAHSLGMTTSLPLFWLLLSGRLSRVSFGEETVDQSARTLSLIVLCVVADVLSFAQSTLPLLFLPILALSTITYRLGAFGAGIGMALLLVIGGLYTLSGLGPVTLMGMDTGTEIQVFEAYLAIAGLGLLPIAADITERKRLDRSLRESESRYRLLADHSGDIVTVTDKHGVITFASPAIEPATGRSAANWVGRSALDLIDDSYHGVVTERYHEALRSGGRPVRYEFLARSRGKDKHWFEAHARAAWDDDGQSLGVVSTVRNISRHKALEGELAHAAATDPLTGVANRREFLRRLTLLSRRGQGCVAMLDLDHFKAINDEHGHPAGDAVLVAFVAVVKSVIRSGDVLARMGGEEFGLILEGAGIDEARQVCTRILAEFAAVPIAVGPLAGAVTVRASVSAGVARIDLDPDQVLRAADRALYEAKSQGRDRLALAA